MNTDKKPKKSINSKKKGAHEELEFSHECEKYGLKGVHRTAQTNGKLEQSLADCEGLDGIHIEVKRVEKLNINKAMDQAKRDIETKKEKRIPVVFHRINRKPWLATMDFKDWVDLYKAWKNKENK